MNYDIKMQEQIKNIDKTIPTLLLHACCAPCSSSVIEKLSDVFKITILFYNPNITEEERKDDLDLVSNFVDSMCQYTTAAFKERKKSAIRNQMMRDGESGEEIRTIGEQLEKNRKNSHDMLILQTKRIDLVCREYGLPEIYGKIPEEYKKDISGLLGEKNRKNPGVVEARHDLANWTWDFILSCTICMDLETNIDMEDLDIEKNREDFEKAAEIYERVDKKSGVKNIMHLLIDKNDGER